MATLKDIANLAGVSQGTVSNVLNGRGNVSSEKIKIVQAAAAQLGYTVNARAKLLRKGSSNILALILPNTRTRCYNDIYTCFKSCAEKYGYSVSVYLTNDIPAKELALISKLRSDMVAGAALISCLREDGNPYLDAGFTRDALLYLERKPLGPGNYLGFDYQTAGKALALAARSQKERFSLLTELPAYSNDTELRGPLPSTVTSARRASCLICRRRKRPASSLPPASPWPIPVKRFGTPFSRMSSRPQSIPCPLFTRCRTIDSGNMSWTTAFSATTPRRS